MESNRALGFRQQRKLERSSNGFKSGYLRAIMKELSGDCVPGYTIMRNTCLSKEFVTRISYWAENVVLEVLKVHARCERHQSRDEAQFWH